MKDVNILIEGGADINKALELFGEMDMYEATLNDFLAEIENKLNRIEKYREENKKFMSSPEMNPFLENDEFPYQTQWTTPAFAAIRMLSKVLFMDPFTELSKAWKAIIQANKEGRYAQAKNALDVLENLDTITYDWVLTTLNPILKSKNPLLKINLETELTQKIRKQYLNAYQIASKK
mgnify:CR=1 FL=1